MDSERVRQRLRRGRGARTHVSIVHYAENMGVAGSDYPGYYPIEFGVYQGGWLEAAQRYRRWAFQQKWAQAGKLSQRADVPEIMKNLGVWILERLDVGGRGGLSAGNGCASARKPRRGSACRSASIGITGTT